MLQLIYELRKNCCGWTDGTGREKSKVLQEVLADLKRKRRSTSQRWGRTWATRTPRAAAQTNCGEPDESLQVPKKRVAFAFLDKTVGVVITDSFWLRFVSLIISGPVGWLVA